MHRLLKMQPVFFFEKKVKREWKKRKHMLY